MLSLFARKLAPYATGMIIGGVLLLVGMLLEKFVSDVLWYVILVCAGLSAVLGAGVWWYSRFSPQSMLGMVANEMGVPQDLQQMGLNQQAIMREADATFQQFEQPPVLQRYTG